MFLEQNEGRGLGIHLDMKLLHSHFMSHPSAFPCTLLLGSHHRLTLGAPLAQACQRTGRGSVSAGGEHVELLLIITVQMHTEDPNSYNLPVL